MRYRVLALVVLGSAFGSALGCKSDSTPLTRVPPVKVPQVPEIRVPGQAYFGAKGYVEYVAGNAPVILTAPHGGAVTPTNIPDRVASACGGTATTVTDANTVELVRAMRNSFFTRYGVYPHVIISHLARRKLDANRVGIEASCGNADAVAALAEWHAFIDEAKTAVVQQQGKGWYMDIHGHAHAVPRLELGYLLTDANLLLSDSALDASTTLANVSSVATVAQHSSFTFSGVLRGPESLGSLYAARGYPAVPSASDPSPNGAAYFNGGENTRRHGCGRDASLIGGRADGLICGVQLEINNAGVRDNAANRARFADVTAQVLGVFLGAHWGAGIN